MTYYQWGSFIVSLDYIKDDQQYEGKSSNDKIILSITDTYDMDNYSTTLTEKNIESYNSIFSLYTLYTLIINRLKNPNENYDYIKIDHNWYNYKKNPFVCIYLMIDNLDNTWLIYKIIIKYDHRKTTNIHILRKIIIWQTRFMDVQDRFNKYPRLNNITNINDLKDIILERKKNISTRGKLDMYQPLGCYIFVPEMVKIHIVKNKIKIISKFSPSLKRSKIIIKSFLPQYYHFMLNYLHKVTNVIIEDINCIDLNFLPYNTTITSLILINLFELKNVKCLTKLCKLKRLIIDNCNNIDSHQLDDFTTKNTNMEIIIV